MHATTRYISPLEHSLGDPLHTFGTVHCISGPQFYGAGRHEKEGLAAAAPAAAARTHTTHTTHARLHAASGWNSRHKRIGSFAHEPTSLPRARQHIVEGDGESMLPRKQLRCLCFDACACSSQSLLDRQDRPCISPPMAPVMRHVGAAPQLRTKNFSFTKSSSGAS